MKIANFAFLCISPPSKTLFSMYKKTKPFALFLPPFAPFNLFSHISRLHTFYIFVHSLFWPIFAERGQFSKHKYHIFNNLNKTHRNASFVTPFLPFLPPFNTSLEDFLKAFWGWYQHPLYTLQHTVATPYSTHDTPTRHPLRKLLHKPASRPPAPYTHQTTKTPHTPIKQRLRGF